MGFMWNFIMLGVVGLVVSSCSGSGSASRGAEPTESTNIVDLIRQDVFDESNAQASNAQIQVTSAARSDRRLDVELELSGSNRVRRRRDTSLDAQVTSMPQAYGIPEMHAAPAGRDGLPQAPRQYPHLTIQFGSNGGYVSQGNHAKITTVYMPQAIGARYVDFQFYARPMGKTLQRTGRYLIGTGYNIDVVDGRVQMTRLWRGRNLRGQAFSKGIYTIYVLYKVKDSMGAYIDAEGSYLGGDQVQKFWVR